ncbi:MAG: DUF2220 family protein [Methylococcales bacterium]|nr:DUF2220 family protein [Methylococcales bacterium]
MAISPFITPKELKTRAEKIWQRGELHKAWLLDQPLFPLTLTLPPLTANVLLHQFSAVQTAVSALRQDSVKHNYQLVDKVINHQKLGEQKLPVAVVFTHESNFLRYLNNSQSFAQFQQLSQNILSHYSCLQSWLVRYPFKVMDFSEVWQPLLAVCAYFVQHPQPDFYIRQLDITGVDTKFIESHKGLLSELLNSILPETAYNADITGLSNHGFERRYGLRYDPPTCRFRILDKCLALHGLTDLTLTVPEFKALNLAVKTVFITENKINGLAFPDFPDAIVIFGLGYSVDLLAESQCLQNAKLYYWGDLDTHGFAMLSRLRGYFPQLTSLLMDESTLDAFQSLWGTEPSSATNPANLTADEHSVFQRLKTQGIRLEQERIGFSTLIDALNMLRFSLLT